MAICSHLRPVAVTAGHSLHRRRCVVRPAGLLRRHVQVAGCRQGGPCSRLAATVFRGFARLVGQDPRAHRSRIKRRSLREAQPGTSGQHRWMGCAAPRKEVGVPIWLVRPNTRTKQAVKRKSCPHQVFARCYAPQHGSSQGICAQHRYLDASSIQPGRDSRAEEAPPYPRAAGRLPWPATRLLMSSARWISWSTGEQGMETGGKPREVRVGQQSGKRGALKAPEPHGSTPRSSEGGFSGQHPHRASQVSLVKSARCRHRRLGAGVSGPARFSGQPDCPERSWPCEAGRLAASPAWLCTLFFLCS